MKNNKTILMITIISLMLVFTGITYAYFTAFNNEGSTAEISFGPGKMIIEYADKSDALSLTKTNIQPSDTILIDKTFTLTGANTASADGGIKMPFTISLEYQNTFQNYELYYFLKRTDENENIVVNIIDIDGEGPITKEMVNSESFLDETFIGSYFGVISDWSNETDTQKIANGYFKPNSEKQTVTFNLRMMFPDFGRNQDYNKGATFNGKVVIESPEPTPFAEDSWETIANNVKNGNASKYKVGTEKEIEIGGKSYTVRVANNTTPAECNDSSFSETACGFVVEFVEIIEFRDMKTVTSLISSSDTHYEKSYIKFLSSRPSENVGGWPATVMRTYANGDFYNNLPEELRNVIADTKVISGHGSTSGETNFTSTDKIYLLSPHEVWEEGTNNQISKYDTAWSNTRQLDYYKARNVTTDGHWSSAIKWYKNDTGEMATTWWLRAAYSSYGYDFLFVASNGYWSGSDAGNNSGFAPAFRIG